jgi:hypothetical protein
MVMAVKLTMIMAIVIVVVVTAVSLSRCSEKEGEEGGGRRGGGRRVSFIVFSPIYLCTSMVKYEAGPRQQRNCY